MFSFFKKKDNQHKPPLPPSLNNIDQYKQHLPNVLEGENPWRIVRESFSRGGHGFTIEVFMYEKTGYTNIASSCESLFGVTNLEFSLTLTEHFSAVLIDHYPPHHLGKPVWATKEEAQKVIDELNQYYENFYIPQAVMNRLACYSYTRNENAMPPYFVNYPIVQDAIKKYKHINRKRDDEECI